ncbi:hypothetical protein BDW69DRAFT_203992 [Aspergillus filifer]
MKLLEFLVIFASLCGAQPVPSLPFPFPFCASTTTISLGGTYTATSTSIFTSISITRTRTTTYSPTEISCLSTATTFSAYRAPLITLAARDPAPQITIPPILPTTCPSVPAITILPPTISNEPCTRVEGDFSVMYVFPTSNPKSVAYTYGFRTSTITTTTSGISTTTSTPISTQTITETWIQPTPTSYDGLNYYQYLNGYNYNTDTTGLGGGGFETSDWNANYTYYTSGLTSTLNFESPNWPTGPANCQLPGQSQASDCSQWTVVFQGFLFARLAGNYEVYSPIASETNIWQDNAGFWWGGTKAYSTYTDSNVDGAATPLEVQGASNRYTYELAAGEFLPFTWIFANGQGPAANRGVLTGPDGVTKKPKGSSLGRRMNLRPLLTEYNGNRMGRKKVRKYGWKGRLNVGLLAYMAFPS